MLPIVILKEEIIYKKNRLMRKKRENYLRHNWAQPFSFQKYDVNHRDDDSEKYDDDGEGHDDDNQFEQLFNANDIYNVSIQYPVMYNV